MSDKLINKSTISTQVEFDEFGGFTLTEVLDADLLEAVGGGGEVKIPIPDINLYCPTTNNCPPPTPPTPPAPPTPTPKPPEPPKTELDGDEG
ncbi:hypothetical protein [Pseudoduganella chitinolytica]|uniref:Bacteriocin n=1 Tax=Pseudoduganella chitinolytica TaxID=34070 RepID=A0ABY8B4A1_9BURK|nr:hypothetical protein [Pseudoduganella chitinolytica]WEF30782.1 hypothetical protein PX653_14995 [Pseudoduganella chitinolytica]